MPRCRKCGADTVSGGLCPKHRREWTNRRVDTYGQALAEHGGELTANNLRAVQKRQKQLLRAIEAAEG